MEQEVDYLNLSTKELFDRLNSNEEILLKSKNLYRKMDSVNLFLGLVSTSGIFLFGFAPNPYLKLAGLVYGFLSATASIAIIKSKKYTQAKHEYEVALKINKELTEEIDKRLDLEEL